MKKRIRWMLLLVGLVILTSSSLSAQEQWVYRYDGSANDQDEAYSIAMDSNGDLYAAGFSGRDGTAWDFTILSLSPAGTERWVYRFDASGEGYDNAFSIAAGSDGNLYAAGWSSGVGTFHDFTVLSLTDSGAERWVYQYNGPGNGEDGANSTAMGSDGNLYAAGWSSGIGTLGDFTAVSLTDSGVERWVYRCISPGDSVNNFAEAILMGLDGNLYIAGNSVGSEPTSDFTVVSLTTSGVERWVYRYNGPGNTWDFANSIVMGSDGNLYAAGKSGGSGTWGDFTVVSLTDSGVERWVYRYNGPGDDEDEAKSIVMGSDGNLYAAGWSTGIGTSFDFTVIGLTDSGVERWVYRYNGSADYEDAAHWIALGSDSNLYAAGRSSGIGTSSDFTVVSLTNSGVERWVYRYNGPGNGGDRARSIVVGSDGSLYAAGGSVGSGTGTDFTVISLSPEVGAEEVRDRRSVAGFDLLQNSPNPFHHSTLISHSLASATIVTLQIYDITGRLVKILVSETQKPGIHEVRWNRKDNPSGVYFYRLEAGEFVETRKMVVVE
jgi:hypothetical protein